MMSCFNSIPEGDRLGVEFATEAQVNFLKRAGLLCDPEVLRSDLPFFGTGGKFSVSILMVSMSCRLRRREMSGLALRPSPCRGCPLLRKLMSPMAFWVLQTRMCLMSTFALPLVRSSRQRTACTLLPVFGACWHALHYRCTSCLSHWWMDPCHGVPAPIYVLACQVLPFVLHIAPQMRQTRRTQSFSG